MYSDSRCQLHAVERSKQRSSLSVCADHFDGVDRWMVWEAYWLNAQGNPQTGCMHIEVPASSTALVESKSFKLFLHSLQLERFSDRRHYISTVRDQLEQCTAATVNIKMLDAFAVQRCDVPGLSLDQCPLEEAPSAPEKSRIKAATISDGSQPVALYNTNTFRSLCPLTAQPDFATVVVAMSGVVVEPESLLIYLNGYQNCQVFHELCCEKIFDDLNSCFDFDKLSVIMAYYRRGGIDITPMRWKKGQPMPQIGYLPRQ